MKNTSLVLKLDEASIYTCTIKTKLQYSPSIKNTAKPLL